MKPLLVFVLLASISFAQNQENKKHLNPFKWNNPLPGKFETLGVRHSSYESEINNASVGFNILLPPGYHQSGDRRYPVVYLLHGGRPGNENKLLNMVPFIRKAHQSNLIPPTIYVFVNGGPVSHYDYPPPSSISARMSAPRGAPPSSRNSSPMSMPRTGPSPNARAG